MNVRTYVCMYVCMYVSILLSQLSLPNPRTWVNMEQDQWRNLVAWGL